MSSTSIRLDDYLDDSQIPPEGVPTISLGEDDADTLTTPEAAQDISDDLEFAGQLSGVVAGIESIIETIKTTGIKDKASLTYVQLAIRGQLSSMGLESLYTQASLESYSEMSEKQVIASLEGVVDTLTNKLVQFSSKTWKKVSDFFLDFTQDMSKIAQKASAVQDKMQGLSDTPVSDFVKIGGAHYLHLSGKTDIATIVKGYENLTKTNKEAVPLYMGAVKKFYTSYFKAFQAIAGKADWFEKMETGGKVADNFIADVKKQLDTVLDTLDGRLELSGGVILKSRNIVVEALPDLVQKNASIEVDSVQTIKTPTKHEIEQLLQLVIENEHYVKNYTARWKEVMGIISSARADAAIESKEIDGSYIRKLLSRVHSHFTSIIVQGDVMRPVVLLLWHNLHVARVVVKLCDKSVSVYRKSDAQ